MITITSNIRKSRHTQPKAPLIPLHFPGRLSTANVLALSRWSESTLQARIKANKFPPPQKDGRLNFWTTATVREALSL